MQAVLRAEKLTRRVAGEVPVTLVKDASFEIGAGEFVAITGPSGSGKSSLLYLLGLLDAPSSGRLFLNGVETSHLSDDQMADLRLAEIGFVFQFHFLLPEFTALENVMLPMERLARLPPPAIHQRAEGLLEVLGLRTELHKLPAQLSGGEAQRVAIARALANNPRLILADEPTGNLDTAASANVRSIMREIAHRGGHAVAVVTHDPDFAASADRVIHIVDGQIASDKSAIASLGSAGRDSPADHYSPSTGP